MTWTPDNDPGERVRRKAMASHYQRQTSRGVEPGITPADVRQEFPERTARLEQLAGQIRDLAAVVQGEYEMEKFGELCDLMSVQAADIVEAAKRRARVRQQIKQQRDPSGWGEVLGK